MRSFIIFPKVGLLNLFVILFFLFVFKPVAASSIRTNFDIHTVTLKKCVFPDFVKAPSLGRVELRDATGIHVLNAFRDIDDTLKVRFRVVPGDHWTLSYDIKIIACKGEVNYESSDDVVNVQSVTFPHINKKNGLLEFDNNRRFFLLAESLWFCPSSRCPISDPPQQNVDFFNQLIVDRKQKKFNTLLLAFMGNDDEFYRPSKWGANEYIKWNSYDRYFDLMASNSFYIGVGFGFHNILKRIPIQDLNEAWMYLVARYSAYPVFWFIVGEYSFKHDSLIQSNAVNLLKLVKDIDPYEAMITLHPWIYSGDDGYAISKDVLDVNLIQGGHGKPPPLSVYAPRFRVHGEILRSIQIECAFEGVLNNSSENVRECAYLAVQAGSIGFGYGANGVWYPYIPYGRNDYKEWGDAIEWIDALQQPGSSQMRYLFEIYSRLDISRQYSVPMKFDCGKRSPVVSLFGDDISIYYRHGGYQGGCVFDYNYTRNFVGSLGLWVSPSTGEFKRAIFSEKNGRIPIPPNDKDWIYLAGPKTSEISKALIWH